LVKKVVGVFVRFRAPLHLPTSRLSSKGNAYRLLGDLNKALDAFLNNDAAFKAKFYGQGSANMSMLMYIPLLATQIMPVL
jgi:hypothetical protein